MAETTPAQCLKELIISAESIIAASKMAMAAHKLLLERAKYHTGNTLSACRKQHEEPCANCKDGVKLWDDLDGALRDMES